MKFLVNHTKTANAETLPKHKLDWIYYSNFQKCISLYIQRAKKHNNRMVLRKKIYSVLDEGKKITFHYH